MSDQPEAASRSTDVLDRDWLGACRRSGEAVRDILAASRAGTERIRETGTRGEGGDRTLLIDADAEDAVFAQLDALHAEGARFTAVSEERGVVDYGDSGVFVVIDPIDGSLNAKRGLGPHSISIAVADGPTMADVVFGWVLDLGSDEEWRAQSGTGAFLNDVPVEAPPERRSRDGRLELVCIESASPPNFEQTLPGLVAHVHRVRALGSMAISLCQVASTRVDGMVSLWRARAVDVAAAQFIVREAGGMVAFGGYDDPLGAPLDDVEPHAAVVGARSPEALAQLATVARVA